MLVQWTKFTTSGYNLTLESWDGLGETLRQPIKKMRSHFFLTSEYTMSEFCKPEVNFCGKKEQMNE